MGLHTGEPRPTEDNLYAGLDVHRASRVMSAAHGGEILLSARTTDLVNDELPPGLLIRHLGSYQLKDFERPEALSCLVGDGIAAEFPPPRAEPAGGQDGQDAPAGAPFWRRPRVWAAAVAVVVVAAAVIASALAFTGSSSGGPTTNAVVAIDPAHDSVVKRIGVGNSPSSIAAGEGGVWVVNDGDGTVTELSPTGADVRTFGTSGAPTDVATSAGSVWVANRPNIVIRIDPSNGDTTGTVKLKTPASGFGPFVWLGTRPDSVWVSSEDRLARIDPRTLGAELKPLPTPDWGPIDVKANAVWASSENELFHLDRTAEHVLGSVAIPKGPIVSAAGSLWAVNPSSNVVAQIDPTTNQIVRTIPVGGNPAGIAAGFGSIWVASQDGTVTRIDARTADVLATIHVGGSPQDVATGFGRVWVSAA
jgi:YVTN family beta-propeller protein